MVMELLSRSREGEELSCRSDSSTIWRNGNRFHWGGAKVQSSTCRLRKSWRWDARWGDKIVDNRNLFEHRGLLLDELRTFKDVYEGREQHSHVSGTPTVDLRDVPFFLEPDVESYLMHSPVDANEKVEIGMMWYETGSCRSPWILLQNQIFGCLVVRRIMIGLMSFWIKWGWS